MNYFCVLLLMVAVFIGAPNAHCKILTLEGALTLAKENNLTVSNLKLEHLSVAEQVKAIKAKRYPMLMLSGKAMENLKPQDYTFDQGVWGSYPFGQDNPAQETTIESADGVTSQFSASAVLPIAEQYKIGLFIKKGRVKFQSSQERVNDAQSTIVSKVKKAYYNIVQTQNDLDVALESINFYTSLETLVKNRVALQTALEHELDEVSARLAQKKWEVEANKDKLSTQKQRLNSLLGRDIEHDFQVAEVPLPMEETLDERKVLKKALENRASIRMSRLDIEKATLDHKIKKSEYIPDIDLAISYTALNGYTLIPDTESHVGIYASWEFFDWGRKRHELARKKHAIHKAKNSELRTKREVSIEVSHNIRALREAYEHLKVKALFVKAAESKLSVTTNQYRQNSALLQKVLDAQTESEEAKNDYNKAILSIGKSQASLERSMGEG